MVERMGELDAAARHPGVVAPAHFEADRVGDRFAGLGDAAIIGKDEAGEDQRLRALPAFRQPAFDEQLVGALFCWARLRPPAQARAGWLAMSRPSAASAVATMWRAASPAVSYCAFGESWSRNRSGSTIVRIFSPWSSWPLVARCCRTKLPNPPIAPSSIVTTTSCSRTSRLIRSVSSGLAKRASATVVDNP